MTISRRLACFLLPLGALLCLHPAVSSAAALVAGITLALTLGNPYLERTKKLTPRILALSVVGLGFGLNLMVIAEVGVKGIGYTVVGIVSTMLFGLWLGRRLKIDRDASLLVTAGTAICGGSAIAAVASVIRSRSQDTSVALVTVFLLNALALVVFPPVGHYFDLTQTQFGLWSALAIHDTSSVVGATLQYGAEALAVGTTVKLARALWIIPLALALGFARGREQAAGQAGSFKKPWFILGFVMAAALMTWVPSLHPVGHWIEVVAKRALVLTLFLIGANLTRETVKAVGYRPLVQGATLWVCVSVLTLSAVLAGWIH